mmetsp:Transcript_65124/g.191065  ORF Transcript_65124/g.191065 Transcript_65124/m.191065 type:complete len:225 (+) Transcript_65124:336-1010(+)
MSMIWTRSGDRAASLGTGVGSDMPPEVLAPLELAEELLLLRGADGARPHDANPAEHLAAREVVLPDHQAAREHDAAAEPALAVDKDGLVLSAYVALAPAHGGGDVRGGGHATALVVHRDVELMDPVPDEDLPIVGAPELQEAGLVAPVHAQHGLHLAVLAERHEVLGPAPALVHSRVRGAIACDLELAHGVAARGVIVRPDEGRLLTPSDLHQLRLPDGAAGAA